MDRGALLALAERVEAYDPKRSSDNRADEMPLDLAVAQAVGKAPADAFVMRGSVTGYGCGDGRGGYGNCAVERYTRSLDAAMTLVPAGCDWMIDNFDGNRSGARCSAGVFVAGDWQNCKGAATPALALTAAALRALAAQQESR